jgi:hypothetical protein
MSDDKRLERIENKIDKITDKQQDQHVTLVRLTDQVEIHVKGIRQTHERIDLQRREIDKELAPVVKHVAMVNAGIKIISGLIVLATGIEGVVALLEYLKK